MMQNDGIYSWTCTSGALTCDQQIEQISYLLVTASATQQVCSIIAGMMNDRFGSRLCMTIGLISNGLAIVLFRFSSQTVQLYHLSMVLFGSGTAFNRISSSVYSQVYPTIGRQWFFIVSGAVVLCALTMPILLLIHNGTGISVTQLLLLFYVYVLLPIGIAAVSLMPGDSAPREKLSSVSVTELSKSQESETDKDDSQFWEELEMQVAPQELQVPTVPASFITRAVSVQSSETQRRSVASGRPIAQLVVRSEELSPWSFLHTSRLWLFIVFISVITLTTVFFDASYLRLTSDRMAQIQGYVKALGAIIAPALGWCTRGSPAFVLNIFLAVTATLSISMPLVDENWAYILAGVFFTAADASTEPVIMSFAFDNFGYNLFGRVTGAIFLTTGVVSFANIGFLSLNPQAMLYAFFGMNCGNLVLIYLLFRQTMQLQSINTEAPVDARRVSTVLYSSLAAVGALEPVEEALSESSHMLLVPPRPAGASAS
ncbi:MAG: uncharacterized protein KVP18_003374 [Porospora cf. gigantea A]|uniref:uncharacterized protein n=2 Tax=Porospora cf. gigantea A TaxID=2853593 RepID=UPI003559CC2A|nr:MAG: hypothetical protein KVP18_003374 [Porospora cf. gigantea A]